MAFRFFAWFTHQESACAFVAERSMANEECDEIGPACLFTRAEALNLGIPTSYTIHEGLPLGPQQTTQNIMAKLKAPVGGTGLQIENLAPAGQHVAVCLRINDLFGVERTKFKSATGEKEMKDVTRFVFGFIGQDQKPYLVQTYEFTISGAPGSNLSDFLKGWLGQAALMGWDYCEMLGKGALITLAHTPSKSNPGKIYADITNISQVPAQMMAYVPPAAHFEAMVVALEKDAASRAPAAPGAPAPLPPATPPATFHPPTFAPPTLPVAPVFTPPPPPVPVADTRTFYVHVNGATLPPVPASELPKFPPTAPAMAVGETTWSTVAAYLPKAAAAPATTADEDVPF